MIKITVQDLMKATHKGASGATVVYDGRKQKVLFNRVKNGFGYKTFMLCPLCGSNCNILYFDYGCFRCPKCCSKNFYKGIQNTTKGGYDYIAYKMERFAEKSGIGQFDFPFDYSKHPKPKWKHKAKWEKNLAIMQCLENMRFQSIVFNRIWDNKTIQKVEQGKNKYVSYPLSVLKAYLFDIQ